MSTLDAFAIAKLDQLTGQHLKREPHETWREDGIWVHRAGRRLLSVSCNDYLNLTHHPDVKAAAVAAIQTYGAGAGASRLVTGNHPLLGNLEQRLALLKGTEAACVFGSGYLANAGIVPVVIAPDDLLLLDELSHACLFAGAQLSRARVEVFRHNDMSHLRALLSSHRANHPHALILTDGVFSMDGDLAPLQELSCVAGKHDSWLMTDDAHGFGVLGQGRGSAFANGTKPHIDLQMGTLSKAIGSYGGYVCASQPVIDLIKTRARTLIYSTGLPPASAAAASAALDIIEADPALCARPLAKARAFTRTTGLPLAESPIVPIRLGEPELALEAQAILEREGFLAIAIRPPTVPAGTARLRLAFSAGHPDAEIERLAAIVRDRVLPMTA
ncbi:MAG TPA: aminotransferase class I/II-fold pyridoxal phosphate-dependent enzyme [Rhizomicrobium sp.]|jgi:8-amino-7-oxononanoate synthase|nr:aminotransferase class I/II-fold pyridoxal phosphate-dependent enzyme [Rhizomicrobium sp.]